ncbi:MAG: hypothetical protein F6J95_027845 [Leptolyngbya sp. SIO1E4]|nr:hypothetical protein [Leptolyngbya sp. SIO1E4]
MKGLIPYVLAGVAISSVALAQQPITSDLPPEPLQQTNEDTPRRLTITDPEDLKVKQGDGPVGRSSTNALKPVNSSPNTFGGLRQRTRERERLESQHQQLNLTLQKLQNSTITTLLQPAAVPALAKPHRR